MTYANFIALFPELSKLPQVQVEALIAHADLAISDSAFGDIRETVLAYRAAHMIACSPFAQSMRLVSDTGETIYSRMLTQFLHPKSYARGLLL